MAFEVDYLDLKAQYLQRKKAKLPGTNDFFTTFYVPKKKAFDNAKALYEETEKRFGDEEMRRAIEAREAALKEEKLKEHQEKEAVALVSSFVRFSELSLTDMIDDFQKEAEASSSNRRVSKRQRIIASTIADDDIEIVSGPKGKAKVSDV